MIKIGSSVPAYADAKSVENGVNGRCETNATAPAYNPDKVEIQPNVDGDLIVNWEVDYGFAFDSDLIY